MKYKEIYNKVMPEEKINEEKFNIFGHYIGRPLSILLTMPLINTKVKPTTITKISIVFVLIGFSLVSFGNSLLFSLLGWLFFLLWNLFDGVDGNLARCTNQCSKLGDLWDTMGGYIAMICIYFSAGIASFYAENLVNIMPNYWYLIIGGCTSIFSIFPRLIMHKKKSSNPNAESVLALSDKKRFGLKNIVAMNFISPSGFLQIIFLFCILTRTLNIFLLFYAFVNTSIMLLSLYKLLKE